MCPPNVAQSCLAYPLVPCCIPALGHINLIAQSGGPGKWITNFQKSEWLVFLKLKNAPLPPRVSKQKHTFVYVVSFWTKIIFYFAFDFYSISFFIAASFIFFLFSTFFLFVFNLSISIVCLLFLFCCGWIFYFCFFCFSFCFYVCFNLYCFLLLLKVPKENFNHKNWRLQKYGQGVVRCIFWTPARPLPSSRGVSWFSRMVGWVPPPRSLGVSANFGRVFGGWVSGLIPPSAWDGKPVGIEVGCWGGVD